MKIPACLLDITLYKVLSDQLNVDSTEYGEQVKIFYRDELTDKFFYKSLASKTKDEQFRKNLLDLSKVEHKHANFWKSELKRLNIDSSNLQPRYGKIRLLFFIMKIIGSVLTVRMLEHGETTAIEQYKNMLNSLPDDSPVKPELSSIIDDEINHEDIFENQIEKTEEQVEKNRDIIYGMSDGLVEVLGAIAGLSAIVFETYYIALGGLVVAISGSMSMSLGAYLAAKHQNEYRINQIQKESLFKPYKQNDKVIDKLEGSSAESASRVGFYYLMGAAIPIFPFMLLSRVPALITSVTLVALAQAVSNSILALSMNARILRSAFRAAGLTLITAAATFLVGEAFHIFFNVSLL